MFRRGAVSSSRLLSASLGLARPTVPRYCAAAAAAETEPIAQRKIPTERVSNAVSPRATREADDLSELPPNNSKEERQQWSEDALIRFEHEMFLKFCDDHEILMNGVRPAGHCSSTRLFKEMNEYEEWLHAQPSNFSAVESETDGASKPPHLTKPPPPFVLGRGRGLVATQDLPKGTVVVSMPVLTATLHQQRVEHMACERLLRITRKFEEQEKPDYKLAEGEEKISKTWVQRVVAAVACCPGYHDIEFICRELGVQERYFPIQMHLALWIAHERCQEDSIFRPYFESLPHPVIHDTVSLFAHKELFDKYEIDEYWELHKDYALILERMRDLWVQNMMKEDGIPPDATGHKPKYEQFVPPLRVLNWAWRFIISRQMPVPLHDAPVVNEARRARNFDMIINYNSWAIVNNIELVPALTPLVELVEHGAVPNVVLDVVRRDADEAFDFDPEEFLPATKFRKKLEAEAQEENISEEERQKRAMLLLEMQKKKEEELNLPQVAPQKPKKKAVYKVRTEKSFTEEGADEDDSWMTPKDKVVRWVQHMFGTQFVPRTFQRRPEKPLPEGTAKPHIELMLLKDVKEGERLVHTFNMDNTKAFGLYRHGFVPYK